VGVAAVVKRFGFERLSRPTPKAAVVRYERQRPGERPRLNTKPGRFGRAERRFFAEPCDG